MFVYDKQEIYAWVQITKKQTEFDKFKFIQQLKTENNRLSMI